MPGPSPISELWIPFLLLVLTGLVVIPADESPEAPPSLSTVVLAAHPFGDPEGFARCPADHPRGRDLVDHYLTSSSQTIATSRAEAGLTGIAPEAIELMTDAAQCAFVHEHMLGKDDDPDFRHVFYQHSPTGRILTAFVITNPFSGPDEQGNFTGVLGLQVVTVYDSDMNFIAGVAL